MNPAKVFAPLSRSSSFGTTGGGGITSERGGAAAVRRAAVAATERDFNVGRTRKTKRIILVRHGRSTWNELLGAHKRAEWEEQEKRRTTLRGALKNIFQKSVRAESRDAGCELLDIATGAGDHKSFISEAKEESTTSPATGKPGRLGKAVRSSVKHVANALLHAGQVKQVDHPLSVGGLAEARALRASVAGLTGSDGLPPDSPESAVLGCKLWYVSPFARALQTAAYAVAPLYRRDACVQLRVTPQAREVVRHALAQDCQGKKGNVGFRIAARALGKTVEAMEEEDEDPQSRTRGMAASERQEELGDIAATLCAMDLAEVGKEWWSDVSNFKKEHLRLDDMRIRKFVANLLKDEAECIGIVGHSLFFQRMIHLFHPFDPGMQEQVRAAMRNGAPAETQDPFHDKIMNCGTLVLTFQYWTIDKSVTAVDRSDAEIVAAQFLFGGRMESAVPTERQCIEEPDDAVASFDDAGDASDEQAER